MSPKTSYHITLFLMRHPRRPVFLNIYLWIFWKDDIGFRAPQKYAWNKHFLLINNKIYFPKFYICMFLISCVLYNVLISEVKLCFWRGAEILSVKFEKKQWMYLNKCKSLYYKNINLFQLNIQSSFVFLFVFEVKIWRLHMPYTNIKFYIL